MTTHSERLHRGEAILQAVDTSDAEEIDGEAGEVERQSRQVESAFARARRRKDSSTTDA